MQTPVGKNSSTEIGTDGFLSLAVFDFKTKHW